uniref:ADAM10 endopeptidase n=1 Tax=Globodera pallida TaxID=36090 RepID=A0A183CIH7_GLOPA
MWTFHLKIHPLDNSNSLFATDHIIDVDGEHHTQQIRPHGFLYEGQVVGDPGSFVHGTLLDGVFDGFIVMGDGRSFTVEKTARYFDIGRRPDHFHSFIYADEEINHKRFRRAKRDVPVDDQHHDMPDPTHGCGLTKQRREEMLRFQESAAAVDQHRPFSSYMKQHQQSHLYSLRDEDFSLSFPERYLGNRTKRDLKPEWREIRGKRIYEVRTCTIYLQADHKLYAHIYNKEGNRDHVRTREEIVSLLYNHIKAVNSIYENTDFHGINGINFAIQRTTIYTPDTCGGDKAGIVGNPFCEENVDVSHYLNSNSQKDHSAFCLAYSLTYRDFLGGTLGLAWVASPSQSTAGGICQRFQRYNEQQRGGVNRSLNTGIITLVNYGNRVPPRVSQLTLAHEIGHNFGSPHDFPVECQPGLPDGNFIMFASATSGDKPNNSKFSKCSVANISEVLYEVLNQFGRKKNCFTDRIVGNPFCEENVDVSHYLNSNSQKDHSAFCLAYSLTYRDFLGGTLGLAWVASPSQSTAGGICQRFQRYNEQQRGGVNRSLNTGIITLVNYGNRVPPRVPQLTLAHEIGHNFGSPHDFPVECQPGLPDGNFIMFASATSGDKPNNSKFSKCSVANISEVLYEVLNQLKSFCGNQIREDGEECDCGFSKQDCHENQDTCCAPRENNDERTMCRRLPGKKCSPSEGICCRAADCAFVQRNGRVCREESECQYEQKCDGTQAKCPESRNKGNGKACQESTKVCLNGSCSGSICAHHGMRDCFLTEGKPEELCQLACETEAGCQAAANIPRLTVYTQEGRRAGQLLLPPGSPCNNYQGYCDIFRKCRSVDSNGPLSRLRTLLFNSEKIQEFKEWIKEFWWACVMLGIIIIMFMALFVKCCAVHTPSTNPNKLPAQHFSDTLRHPGTLLRRGHSRPPAVISNNQHHPAGADARRGGGREMRTAVPSGVVSGAGGAGRSRPTTRGTTTTATTANNAMASARPSRSSHHHQQAHPVEPPPPYQPTDPASSAAVHHHRDLSAHQPPSARHPSGVVVPTTSSSAVPAALPLIPGPPLPGQGPKPGRRKPRASPQKRKDGNNHRDASSGSKKMPSSSQANEKESKRNKRSVK